MREHFLLNPDIVFLNHGSFGACPKPVFETYQAWQLELERQPVEFLGRRYDTLMDTARARLAQYVHCDTDNLIFVPNATAAVNIVARSLKLETGDEILSNDHEYGACDLTWNFVVERTGAKYIHQPIPYPIHSQEEIIDSLWSGVTERTRIIYISHITSPTALTFPVAEICRRAREAGIITIIDGAHAPGQVPVNITALDCDFYTGNCHKWLCAPKGAAFLFVRPEFHAAIEPAIISWGWLPGGTYVNRNQWQGTRDIAQFLSVPAAIDFQEIHDWDTVRQQCHALASETRTRINDLTGLPPLTPDSTDFYMQMCAASLPEINPEVLKRRLYDEFRIEVPIVTWNNRHFIRVSFQGYNICADADCLLEALKALL